MNNVILKLSGEVLKGRQDSGIDYDKLLVFAKDIKEAWLLNKYNIGIVIGGGNFFRGRDSEKIGLSRVDCDYMGMMGTMLNSIALNDCLKKLGVKVKLYTSLSFPKVMLDYNPEDAIKSLEEGYVNIYAGGTGNPYCSTDSATLMKAKDTNVKLVLMGKSGVDGVYDKDPRVFEDAKKYDILTHKELFEKELKVMDLEAAKLADECDIDILVFEVDKECSITKAFKGEVKGTLIKKEN